MSGCVYAMEFYLQVKHFKFSLSLPASYGVIFSPHFHDFVVIVQFSM